MGTALRDLRFALRALRATPVLFATAVLTLGAGIGLATGVFAVAYGVLLRPLPYADADRLVQISLRPAGSETTDGGIALAEFDDWRSRLRAFAPLTAYSSAEFTVRAAGESYLVRAAMVADDFFEALGLHPAQGSTRDVRRGASAAALSARFASRLGPAARDTIAIGTGTFRIAAVLRPDFTFPTDDIDVWVHAGDVPAITMFGPDDHRRFGLVARVAPGVTLEQAREDAARVVREVGGRPRVAVVRRLQDRLREDARPGVVPFLAGAALVLLIACANVSGLLVGRAMGRQGEFALRRALGGGARHVLRASLSESVAIAVCGWAVGLWIAHLVVQVFVRLAQGAIPNLHAIRIDAPVVLASLGLALVVAVLSGAAPALRALRSDPNTALKQSSARLGRAGRSARAALVVLQIALTVVLLVAAGLLLRTVVRIVSAERGFDADHALTLRLMLTQTVRFEAKERAPFVARLVEEARALPGVVTAGVGSDLPTDRTQIMLTIRIITDTRDELLQLSYAAATPGYLEAIGAVLIRGRLFEERDRLAAPPPVVITESAARVMFPNRDPVGVEWPALLPGPRGKRVKPLVIGIVRDVEYGGLDRPAPAAMFGPWEQLAPGKAHLVVRTAGDAASLAPPLRQILRRLDPTLPLLEARTLEDVVSGSIANRRLRLQLAAAFAALALLLAGVALWGAVAQSVLDRRHEIAVRLALGATAGSAVRLMLRGGVAMIAAGVLIGAAAGAGAARALRHLLLGVGPGDPATFVAATLLAGLVSLAACYVPARRAAAISPAELLREP